MSAMTGALIEVARGCAARLGAGLDAVGATRVVLVADAVAYGASGADRAVAPAIAPCLAGTVEIREPLPTRAAVQRVADAVRSCGADAVVAVGGGTVMDVAKAAAAVAASASDPVADGIAPGIEPVPVVALPTTAGTGAEATATAVCYVEGVKHSLEDPRIRPRVALVDAALCDSLPPYQTACTGLDALCQALESMWAIRSSAASREHAAAALRLAAAHLEVAVLRPAPPARDAMSRAAHLAGRAIDVSRTTLPHALSYTLTARFGVPHGHAVALFAAPVIADLAGLQETECADPRGVGHVREVLASAWDCMGAGGAAAARQWLEGLLHQCGLPSRLGDVGVTSDADRELLVAGVNAARLGNHPRRADAAALRRLVAEIA